MMLTDSFLFNDWRKRALRAFAILLIFLSPLGAARAGTGASVPWTTYEAEAMAINGGTVLGPPPRAVDKNATVTNTVTSEASGRQCVQLSGTGQYVEFAAQSAANTLVVRYSVPDTADGTGTDYTISLYINGSFVRKVPVTSRYSWLYGGYTFSNNPGDGSARDYYDEARLMNLSINPGYHVRLQVDADDTASYYVIDLVDLEQIGSALTQPGGSRSILSYGAHGDGINDDTVAIQNCVAGGGVIWFPPGNYVVTNDINVPSGTTIQGAGMWYTTFVGNPVMYAVERGRVRLNGAGSNTHFADFAILGKLTYRNDSEANDGFSEFFGTNSSIARVWVEHTKTGAWIANSVGMVISDCRFRDTIADGINLDKNCQGCIVTNCTARNTGDDSFAIWPAVYTGGGTNNYTPGWNVITHCTAQSPFFANGCGIYGAISNRVEDSFFQDIPDGCGILIAGTFPVGSYVFQGITTAQRCDLNRCGGNDPGWRWRGALTICPDGQTIPGLNVNNINISNSLSYAVQFLHNTLTGASMSGIKVSTYGVAVPPYHPQDPYPNNNDYIDGIFGVYADSSINGSVSVSDLTINGTNIIAVQTNAYLTDCVNKSGSFTFNFLTTPISVTIQANPPGHSFSVDGTTYTSNQIFSWTQGASHSLSVASPQNSGTGVQDVWTSWSDGGDISHTITPLSGGTYTANFTTQYYLTMTNSVGGSVSPASGWLYSGSIVNLGATPTTGFIFSNWAGSGSGSYSGTTASPSITMNGPITEMANFYSPAVQSMNWLQQPANAPQGTIISPEAQVQVFDSNNQPLAGASVTVALGSGTGTLTGTLTRVSDANGIAHFNDLSVNQAGPKTLVATVLTGSAPPTYCTSFMVIGPAVALVFTSQPNFAIAGFPFGQQPILQTVDAFGTPTTIGLPANLTVQVGLTNGTGLLIGTTTCNLGTSGSNGIAAFSNLAVNNAVTNVQLIAWCPTPAASVLAGAVLWLDASDATTLTTNGTRVQAWKNKGTAGAGVSGTNLWFTQNSVTLQPWLTNQLNGKSLLTFSKNGSGFGAGCTYLGNIGKSSYTNGNSQMTYFVVARQTEDSIGWQGPVSFCRSGQTDGSGTAGVVVLADGSQSAPYPLGVQRNHPGTPMQADVTSATVGTPFVMSFVDNAGTASLSVVSSNGLVSSNGASIINGLSPYTYNITDVTVGGRLEPDPGTVDNGWDGDVAEVLAFNTALSLSDRTSVQTYLTNKWFFSNGGLSLTGLSQPFTVQPPSAPPLAQSFQGIALHADQSITLAYGTTPGALYHLETTTNLSSGPWVPVVGSVTNATGSAVTFTVSNAMGSIQRFYRSVSP